MGIKLTEPVGDISYAGMFARIPLGLYFIVAGFQKVGNPAAFAEEVRKFSIIPDHLATVYGVLLPYLEIASGGLLVLGAWTTLAAIMSSLLLLSFIIAIGVYPNGRPLFNKDIILLGISLSLLFSGGGRMSVDRFRKSG